MTRHVAFWILVTLFGVSLAAQQAKPTFDVTSVKRSNAPAESPSPYQFSPRRFVARNISLRLVIAALYSDDNRLTDRVDGGPKWIDTDAYDIEGKVLEGPLGLRLVSTAGPVDALVIESIQRPSEN